MKDQTIITEFYKINSKVDSLINKLTPIIKVIPELTLTVNAISSKLEEKSLITKNELTEAINIEIDKLKPKKEINNV